MDTFGKSSHEIPQICRFIHNFFKLLVRNWTFAHGNEVVLWVVTNRSYVWILDTLYTLSSLLSLLKFLQNDHFELLGLRQVFEYLVPHLNLLQKDDDALALPKFRHSNFYPFLLMLLITPMMTLSRVLLVISFTLFLIVANKVDDQDINLCFQRYRKEYVKFTKSE